MPWQISHPILLCFREGSPARRDSTRRSQPRGYPTPVHLVHHWYNQNQEQMQDSLTRDLSFVTHDLPKQHPSQAQHFRARVFHCCAQTLHVHGTAPHIPLKQANLLIRFQNYKLCSLTASILFHVFNPYSAFMISHGRLVCRSPKDRNGTTVYIGQTCALIIARAT